MKYVDQKIEILLQDSLILAVNKPPGLSVHNDEDSTNLIEVLCKQLGIDKLFPVHRLDKETSGIQIFSLNSSEAATLATEFQNKTVTKIYEGILRGNLKYDEGTWTRPLTDKSEGRQNPAGPQQNQVACETRYKVLQKNKYFTYCQFELITGRQHQIRKHAAIAGNHIVGDSRYGDKNYNQKISSVYKNNRMFLHCSEIKIKGHHIQCPSQFSEMFGNPETKA